jgi:hypothetical protein
MSPVPAPHDLYELDDYRQAIRVRLKEQSLSGKRMTLRKLAEKIPIQYTYLSKALNHPKTHLNEDHLFRVCRLLELFPEETDYLFLLRARDTASDPARREHLGARISAIRRARQLNADVQDFNSRQSSREMAYLFDPLCILVHMALLVPAYAESPQSLCPLLGITAAKLSDILRRLRDLDYIENADPSGRRVRVLRTKIHYGTEHPFMRVHQSLLRTLSATHLSRAPEDAKRSFMVTFSSDASSFDRIRDRFQVFLKEIEQVVLRSQPQSVYQMNFDLFRWL